MSRRPRVALIVALLLAMASATVSAQSSDKFVVGIAEWYIDEGVEFWNRVIVPKFKELHPDLDVELRHISWGAEDILVEYVAGVAPDVIQYGGDKFGSFLPALAPLNSFMERKPLEDMDDFPAAAFEATARDGEYFGVPFYLDTRTLVYNKEMFRQAGLDETRGPATWDEVREFAQKTTRTNPSGEFVVEGLDIDTHWLVFSPWVFQAGGRYVGPDLRSSAFDSEGTRAAVAFAKSLFEEYQVAAPNSLGFAIDKGQSAMAIESIGILTDAGDVDPDDIGVSLPPKGPAKQTALVAPNQWGIIKNSRHMEAAWDWIRLASEYEHLVEMTRLNEVLPPRASIAAEDPWASDPRAQVFLQAASIGTAFNGGAPGFENIVHNIVNPTLTSVVFEGQSLSALSEASARINAIIQEELSKSQ